MRKRRYNIFQRVIIKANTVLYTLTGKAVDLLTKIGLWGEFPYEIKGQFGEVIRVAHSYPVNFREEDKRHFDEWKSYDTFPHDLFLARNSWLTDDGIVLKKHRTFIRALPHPIFRFKYGVLYNLKTRLFYRNQKTDPGKKYVLFYDNWSWNNYFHWIIDGLCRAQLVRKNVTEQFTVVLPEASPKYITETLRLFGFADFEYLGKNTRAGIHELYVMNYAAWSGQQHPVILEDMRSTVFHALDISNAKPFRKIYVSRGKQFSRRITNETEVLEVLRDRGYELVYFEGMSFADQVKLMHEVTHFVTSHGANMTNLVFLQPGARILELINNRKPNFCYWSVASSLKHGYRYQLCEIAEADHITVDVNELKKNLDVIAE